MAEHDYVRLAAACFCGEPVKLNVGRGRKPTKCEEHSRPKKLNLEDKQCPACRGFFTPVKQSQQYCSLECGRRTRLGSKPRQEHQRLCQHCANEFTTVSESATYCSGRCKLAAWRAKNPEKDIRNRARAVEAAAPLLCAYFSGYCRDCGSAWSGRRDREICGGCAQARSRAAAKEASRLLAASKHKATARVTACEGCQVDFCPLYGFSHASLCVVCAEDRMQEQRQVGKDRRKARVRGASVGEKVSRIKVFNRDGWLCQLCGIQTPKALMGSYEHNAPELDHIVAIAKGGSHSYANTQCLCRSCNGLKSDRSMDEVLASLEA